MLLCDFECREVHSSIGLIEQEASVLYCSFEMRGSRVCESYSLFNCCRVIRLTCLNAKHVVINCLFLYVHLVDHNLAR